MKRLLIVILIGFSLTGLLFSSNSFTEEDVNINSILGLWEFELQNKLPCYYEFFSDNSFQLDLSYINEAKNLEQKRITGNYKITGKVTEIILTEKESILYINGVKIMKELVDVTKKYNISPYVFKFLILFKAIPKKGQIVCQRATQRDQAYWGKYRFH